MPNLKEELRRTVLAPMDKLLQGSYDNNAVDLLNRLEPYARKILER